MTEQLDPWELVAADEDEWDAPLDAPAVCQLDDPGCEACQ